MLEGRGRAVGQIIGLVDGEPVVTDVQRAGEPVLHHRRYLQGRHPLTGGESGDHDHEDGRRQEAPGPAPVEAGERDSAVLGQLPPEQTRYEIPRNDKEHVYAGESAPENAHVGVVEDHSEHSNRTHAFDIGAELARWISSPPVRPRCLCRGRAGAHLHPCKK